MIKKTAFAAAAALLASVAMANTLEPGSHALKDGSTVHVFENGKMGMENTFGIAVSMPEGTVMETQDGHQARMVGNELARTSALLSDGVD